MDTLYKKACLLAGGILLLLGGCALILLLRQSGIRDSAAAYTACLYQDGRLLQSIPLDQVTETYHFTIDAADGGHNIIEVSPGGIAITEADCPDQICVMQGRVTDSLLPITCLPHRLVIELKPDRSASSDNSPDAVAY
ncbi:MAG: NusG domain II-containing protein [Acetatifactor sp.]|nr:NusG domain II-containing protein [Acetatifactor sp.]